MPVPPGRGCRLFESERECVITYIRCKALLWFFTDKNAGENQYFSGDLARPIRKFESYAQEAVRTANIFDVRTPGLFVAVVKRYSPSSARASRLRQILLTYSFIPVKESKMSR